MPDVLVPTERLARWVENFRARHGEALLSVTAGRLCAAAADGSTFAATLPFSIQYDGPPDLDAFAAAAEPPGDWGILLVRKGGFAVARLSGATILEHKVGQRHVQGRTKAGGQSQQRFARRRDNQARQAYEAAEDHARRILGPGPLVVGGDRAAITEVVGEDARIVGEFLAVPDPKRAVLDQAIRDACSPRIVVVNA